MSAAHWLVGLGMVFSLGVSEPAAEPTPGLRPTGSADLAALREMLRDEQHPRSQSQAALLLVQSQSPDAEQIVRQALQETEFQQTFMAVASAIRLRREVRFTEDVFLGLGSARPSVREAAVETLAILINQEILARLQKIAASPRADLGVRQAAVSTLGRSGCKAAAPILLDVLAGDNDTLRRSAALALEDLAGQPYGTDCARWQDWWNSHKDLTDAEWLQERLTYQSCLARRVQGELERTRAQVVRLHQQLYARLPPADRLGHVQTLVDNENAAIRTLAVGWSVELLPATDLVGRRALADTLLRLSRDGDLEVQRGAVLALGRVQDDGAVNRLLVLLKIGRPPVRAAAARSLAQQATVTGGDSTTEAAQAQARDLRSRVVRALQKALDDPALEVVVEAAEDLGSLGVPEAGPVLAALLHHPSEPVRRAAAEALERVAEPAVLEGLMKALDDSVAAVRFSLTGALGHATGDGRSLAEEQRTRLVSRLQELLVHDPDPGVRSRAATVLGECGTPAAMTALWQRVLAAEDGRVQDKAWAAIVNLIARSGNPDLLTDWDHTLAEAKQGQRRLQLLTTVWESWKKKDESTAAVGPATDLLVQAQLDQGKWAEAFPLIQELLGRPAREADRDRQLRWLLATGDLALMEGNHAAAARAVQAAQPFLGKFPTLAPEVERLQHQNAAWAVGGQGSGVRSQESGVNVSR